MCEPPCSFVQVEVRAAGATTWLPMCSVQKRLLATTEGPDAQVFPAGLTECVVPGLLAGVAYEVTLFCHNAAGWGECGTPSTLRQPATAPAPADDVQIVGGRTREQRDAELRKRAIDLDALPTPETVKTKEVDSKVKRRRPNNRVERELMKLG